MARTLGPDLDQEIDRHVAGIADIPEEEGDDADIGEVVENEDGSASIVDAEEEKEQGEFMRNLAEELEESEMSLIARDLVDKIEKDKEARSKRDEQYAEGLRRSGLGNDAPGGATFDGASKAVHPALAEVCVDFSASSSRELFPPNGPARSEIKGDVGREKLKIAERQTALINWQCLEEIEEYIDEHEQMLTQLPMGGSQYIKIWQDAVLKRISVQFVPIDDVFLPFVTSNFYSAQRITHAQRITEQEFEERVENGFYRDLLLKGAERPDQTKAAEANAKIEGKQSDQENVDGEMLVYEVNAFLKLSVDGNKRLPYLISIDDRSGRVVSIYRNWEEDDEAKKRLHWIVEYGFIPWRGAYKIGLPHLIGGMSAAATGALRALLDAAHVQNFPGAVKMKTGRVGGQSKKLNPTGITEIEGAANVDDIRKLMTPLQYAGPSPVLFQLLGWLTDAIKGVVTTAEEKIAEAKSDMPVGTALALIEQGAKVFSSIHARLHRSQKRAFGIICRLNRKHLDEKKQMLEIGEVLATRQDFEAGLFVIPVSDPNIFSETQRYAQMQMVYQNATGPNPAIAQMHNLYKVIHRIYTLAKIPDIDEFLPKPPEPVDTNFVSENLMVLVGQMPHAFPDQDHASHIEGHMRFITDPFLGASPTAAPKAYPTMIEHIKQHVGFMYAKLMYTIATNSAGVPIESLLSGKTKQPEQADKMFAAASRLVHAQLMQLLQPLGAQMQQIIQQMMATQPPPPMDPTAGAMQVAKIENERKQLADKANAAIEAQKAQQKAQTDAEKLALEQEQQKQDTAIREAEIQHGAARDAAELALQKQEEERKQFETEESMRIEQARLQSQIQHQDLQLVESQQPGNQVPGA